MTLDEAFVKALKNDYESAPTAGAGPRDARLRRADHEGRHAHHAGAHERLRAVGFDDRGILQITLIASWFNYINRVADALGVGRDA